MINVRHFDHGTVSKASRTAAGYLRVPALVTRTGVLEYRMADGSIQRRLRHPDDVFDPKSLATLAGVPVTDEHPSDVLLDTTNTRKHIRGVVGDRVEKVDGHFVGTDLTIMDAELLDAVEAGEQVEVSCGYLCELVAERGTYDGVPYDVRQKNIRYNHVAVTRKGRAGSKVRLQLDSADAVQVEKIPTKGDPVEKINLGGKDFDASPELAAAVRVQMEANKTTIASQADSLASATAALAAEKSRADRAQATADSVKGELDKANAKVTAQLDAASDPKAIQAAVASRIRCLDAGKRTLDEKVTATLDSMSDKDIKIAVIKAERPKVVLDGKSDDYVEAVFDQICDGLGEDKTEGLGKTVHADRSDKTTGTSADARKRSMERDAKRWQGEAKT